MYPDDLLYNETHQWARVEDGIATVGITEYAQEQLNDLVYVDLPEVGRTVTQGEPFGSVESVKAVSDVVAPVSGTVVAVNEAVGDEPDKINQDPYGEGWLVKIEMTSPDDTSRLLNAEAYQKFLAEQG